MKTIGIVILHLLAILCILQGWYVWAGLVVLFLSVRVTSYTLIPIAIVLDAYLGAFYTVPLLSIYATLWCMFVEYFRPQMSIIQSTYGQSS